MVWPFLLLAYAACAWYNWRAGLAFVVALVVCQIILSTTGGNEQRAIFIAYSTIGILTFFFLDKTAGAVLCLTALVYGIHLIDLLAHKPKMIIAEVAFFMGAFASAYIGPNGGLMALGPSVSAGHSNIHLGRPGDIETPAKSAPQNRP